MNSLEYVKRKTAVKAKEPTCVVSTIRVISNILFLIGYATKRKDRKKAIA
tara:strand:+ start:131 stop:280 length:150 start_codon:yes stop_codon:yes gene_type:complete